MKPIQKDIRRGYGYETAENNFPKIISYNSKSNSDEGVEFVNIYLLYNKLSLQLLVNDSTTYSKKRRINKIGNKSNKVPNTNKTRKQKSLL